MNRAGMLLDMGCRITMNMDLPIVKLKGIGEKSAELFGKLGIYNCGDLIHYYPRSYDKYEKLSSFKDSEPGDRIAVYATVKNSPKIAKFNGKSILSFFVTDGENTIEIRFFNSPFLLKAFKPNDKKVFRGYVRCFRERIIMDQPKVFSYEEYLGLENSIVPIYPLTKDLSNLKISKAVNSIISEYKKDDYLVESELKEMSISSLEDAIKNIHFPKNEESLYLARRRIVFEEFMSFYRISKAKEKDNINLPNNHKMIEVAECNRLLQSLPYELTNAQKRAVNDIFTDMESEYLMNRCVQGDVGSGKTIVAVLALLMCAANGMQGAMMAPTEVLARQHFENIKELSKQYHLCLRPVLLTGKMGAKDKREALAMIKNGEANVVLGTHAIIQDNVEFYNLSLVVTDEQHRFGVRQREALRDKGLSPHLLVMSATPIPRTLAMIVFAGLAISVIDELPKGRIPILNCTINSSLRIKAYEKIRAEINKGHQAYVICPMVYENEDDEYNLKSVEGHTRDIKKYFGETIRVASLNGKMKAEEKTRIMESFKAKDIDILVSTTVIEVGIDVPNATVILIENAERFGLSQLHQLRGRVGRGKFESYCILISDTKSDDTMKRLKIVCDTNDGFKIANEDMKMRGPGELNGIRQSGEPEFGLADFGKDADILMLVASKYESLKDRLPDVDLNLIDFRTI